MQYIDGFKCVTYSKDKLANRNPRRMVSVHDQPKSYMIF